MTIVFRFRFKRSIAELDDRIAQLDCQLHDKVADEHSGPHTFIGDKTSVCAEEIFVIPVTSPSSMASTVKNVDLDVSVLSPSSTRSSVPVAETDRELVIELAAGIDLFGNHIELPTSPRSHGQYLHEAAVGSAESGNQTATSVEHPNQTAIGSQSDHDVIDIDMVGKQSIIDDDMVNRLAGDSQSPHSKHLEDVMTEQLNNIRTSWKQEADTKLSESDQSVSKAASYGNDMKTGRSRNCHPYHPQVRRVYSTPSSLRRHQPP